MGHLIIKVFQYHSNLIVTVFSVYMRTKLRFFGRFVIEPLEKIRWIRQSKTINVKEAKL